MAKDNVEHNLCFAALPCQALFPIQPIKCAHWTFDHVLNRDFIIFKLAS
jgi:hypothetical protein